MLLDAIGTPVAIIAVFTNMLTSRRLLAGMPIIEHEASTLNPAA